MTVHEAATRLEVSVTMIYTLCRAGLLPHSRIGIGRGTIRISDDDLAAYRASARVEGPKEEVRYRRRATASMPAGGPSPMRFAEELARRAGKATKR